jgi:hypothetical protein
MDDVQEIEISTGSLDIPRRVRWARIWFVAGALRRTGSCLRKRRTNGCPTASMDGHGSRPAHKTSLMPIAESVRRPADFRSLTFLDVLTRGKFPASPEIALTKNEIYFLPNNQQVTATFADPGAEKGVTLVYSPNRESERSSIRDRIHRAGKHSGNPAATSNAMDRLMSSAAIVDG